MSPDGAALLASPVRRRMLDHLVAHGAQTALDLAAAFELHITTVRFHLDQLVGTGLIEVSTIRPTTAGRPKKLYAAAHGSLTEVPTPRHSARDSAALATLTGLLAEALTGDADGGSITPFEAGRRWSLNQAPDPAAVAAAATPADTPGRWLAKVGSMIDVLGDWGYTPDLTTSDGGRTADITLSHCPFLDLARDHTAVVCGIHRGLIAGSMERLGESNTDVSLEPFATPTRCFAHVTTHTPFRGRSGADNGIQKDAS